MKPIDFEADPLIGAHLRLHRLLARGMVMHDRDPAEVERKLSLTGPMSGSKWGVMVDHLVERKQTMRDQNGKALCYEGGKPILQTYMKNEQTLDQGDYYSCLVRKQAKEIGNKERRLQDYTPEELQAMCKYVVGKIAASGESNPSSRNIAPWYPTGWQDAMRDVCDEDQRIPTAVVMADAGAV